MDACMSQEEKIILLSEFAAGTICELSHGPCDNTEHAAIDYLVIPMGTKDQHGIETIIASTRGATCRVEEISITSAEIT